MSTRSVADAVGRGLRVAWLPNSLTLLRVGLVPVVVVVLMWPTPAARATAGLCFLVACVTDFLDGWLARRHGITTALGTRICPMRSPRADAASSTRHAAHQAQGESLHAGATEEATIAILRRDGFVVLPDLLSAKDTNQLAHQLEPWFERTPRCRGDFYGWKTTRIGGLLSKAAMTQRLVLNPRILAIAEALLKPHCDFVQLNLTQGVRVHPGERAQAPHSDEEMWPCATHGADWLINVMWAMNDFTEENGATRLWPGSHAQALNRAIDPKASVPGVMERGSALVFLGSLTHGAGANYAAHARTGIIVSYCLGWLKTYENQFLAYPRDVARTFAPELQRLIGYQMHRPNLGGWEGQDPIEHLRGDAWARPHVDALTPEIARELKEYYGE